MDTITAFAAKVCDELKETVLAVSEEQARQFYERILSHRERQIFVCGAGRCQYMLRAFCMRLMHLGFRAHVAGDTATPAVEPGDLVVIADGAGYLNGAPGKGARRRDRDAVHPAGFADRAAGGLPCGDPRKDRGPRRGRPFDPAGRRQI